MVLVASAAAGNLDFQYHGKDDLPVTHIDHGYVFLFILFMAGLVGLIEKAGGLLGITAALRGYVKSSRSAQDASFGAGCIIFFDDYGANEYMIFWSKKVV